MALNHIEIDISKYIEETQEKINRIKNLVHQVQALKNTLPSIKTMTIGIDDSKFAACLLPTQKFPELELDIESSILIAIVQKNIEDNTALINELAKELGIEVE
ncbi:DUF1359 domain-containing protein [Lactococcus cremoris]|uniref:DUF1359 domain-containing protein n=1 Tax=Lactococcus lactis subsp. cremoris TaxID=1359 RepID=UPI00218238BB|nr:DUF1359 domain-containing protein [Lactococcus cremoris]